MNDINKARKYMKNILDNSKKNFFSVLSIDFDYFQEVSLETVKTLYPDSIDLSPELSATVWASYEEYKVVNDISINKTEMKALERLLDAQRDVKNIMISHTHKDIYNFIKNGINDRNVNITNIDMHHDMFNKNKTLDCGNWLSYVEKDCNKLNINWVCNPISEEMYGLNNIKDLLFHSIDELDKTYNQYDYIFLCRSDNWLPPHLDKDFDKLSKRIISRFKCPIRFDTRLRFDRMERVEQVQEQVRQFDEEYLSK